MATSSPESWIGRRRTSRISSITGASGVRLPKSRAAPELRALYAMAGADDLPALFDAQPPAAILTGFDPGLDPALEGYAQAHGYQMQPFPAITDRYGVARLWLPPTQTDQTGGNP